ncbi:hypothetical protein NPIL_143621 [Nephila pilipes]|uniref:Uncharacterized protein n=1 Tax=Nephila pilipes TaxID=299642 RepID=A0A8X6MPE7_NEPPI|nr:hypothetical protein NPIL_143621 [Nephila pilipes]
MDRLSKLVEKRGYVRSAVTKLVKRVQNMEEATENLNSLSELLELLDTKEYILKNLDLKVEELVNEPDECKSELKASE